MDKRIKERKDMLFTNIGIIDENFKYSDDMCVGVQADKITYIGKEIPKDSDAFGERYDGKGKVLMPGFYNAHGHSPMSLLRGYGENLSLHDWLFTRIFPFEAKLYSKGVYWATLLTMAESIRFGIVSTTDMYFFLDDMIRAYSVAGTKGNLSRSVSYSEGDGNVEEMTGYKESRDAIIMYDGFENGRIKIDACIHAEYTNTVESMRAIADLAKEFDVRMQVHVSETKKETDECIERYGKTPTEILNECGAFDTPTTAAHCVWINENDREIFKTKGITAASNPCSNYKLASGMCDVPALYEKGVNVAIGTDSVASNNSLNFIEEMKLFAMTGKLKSNDPSKMTPEQVLYSATRAGALSQGRDDCGLLKAGYKADLIAIDVSGVNMAPVHDMLNNIIYAADGKDVCLTMIDGKVCYKDGEFTMIDIEETIAETEKAKDKILSEL